MSGDVAAERFRVWIEALEARHLADLSVSEVGRALRALSSCYVERRGKLSEGGALSGAGKRAAFALFYAPVHFLLVQQVIRSLRLEAVRRIQDLGCGIGSAGAAWALEAADTQVTGLDRHPWAVAESNWTYRVLGVRGHARQKDVAGAPLLTGPATGILAAYTINELSDAARERVLERLLDARSRGARVLVIEPIARRLSPWWTAWADAFRAGGGRADEWRFAAALPDRQRQLARAAGLQPQELTARSLFMAPA